MLVIHARSIIAFPRGLIQPLEPLVGDEGGDKSLMGDEGADDEVGGEVG